MSSIHETQMGGGTPSAKDIQSAYDHVLLICNQNLGAQQAGYTTTQWISLSMAILGIVSGSIVVPALAAKAAAKSVIAAWGGVAGATNAGQLALNSSMFSSNQIVATYAEMVKQKNAAEKAYNQATHDHDVVAAENAITDLSSACVTTPLPPSPAPTSDAKAS
ncbi:hypothetical protein [Burkholderia ubonensis]|uniref:hypothetical protein n=1 Tax=Burkholderia ubonensis TaxID=101571 RepID=UPI0012F73A49|nr:hypothetical protein [Burkholderia ubonensis]